MTGEDVLLFITTGRIKEITLGMTINEVKEKLGQPEEVIGDSKAGYLIYGIVRIGYFGSEVDELGLRFYKHINLNISLNYEDGGERFEINAHTKINEVIRLMNYKGITWDCYDKSNSDYFTILSEIKVAIVFDLNDGSLFMINFTRNVI